MGAGGLGGSVGFEMPRVCLLIRCPTVIGFGPGSLMLVLCHVEVSWTSPG